MFEYVELNELVGYQQKSRRIQTIGKIVMPSRYLQSIGEKEPIYVRLIFNKLNSIPCKEAYLHVYGKQICENGSTSKINTIQVNCYSELNSEAHAKDHLKLLNNFHKKPPIELKPCINKGTKIATGSQQDFESDTREFLKLTKEEEIGVIEPTLINRR